MTFEPKKDPGFSFPCEANPEFDFDNGGAKVQVTGHRTGHRSQVTMKNTCKFAASSYLVGICLFRPFLT